MKVKSLLSIALVLFGTLAIAQTSNLRRAKTSYNKYSDLKSVGNAALGMSDLKSSLENLEKAINHDKTSGLAETWTYYALVNADYALVDQSGEAENYIKKAIEAGEKAKTLEGAAEQSENLKLLNPILAQYELNKGVAAWENQDFKTAYESFDKGSVYYPGDTTLLYYAGLAAINMRDYKLSLNKYAELAKIEEFSDHAQIVLDLSKIYFQEADTVNAIKTAEYGYAKYPENNDLATQYIELNMIAGNEDKVINTINDQITKDANNKILYYYLGIAYNESKDFEKAEEAYSKALAIDPNFVEAYINLGGLILNQGVEIYNTANSDRNLSQADYDAQIAKAHEVFDRAYPHLKKSVEIDNKNIIAIQNLLNYYQIKQNEAKIAETKALLDAASNGSN